ncbi:hypothetical protein HGI47_04395 [Novosphingobium sp. ERN07]|nr:hypothetical protein [Novosphingobium sp. ERN07]
MRKRVAIAAGAALSLLGSPLLAGAAADLARPPVEPSSPKPMAEHDTCNQRQARRFIGMKITGKVQDEIAQAIRHYRIRLIRPGAVITQERRADRINLILDDQGKLTTMRCG